MKLGKVVAGGLVGAAMLAMGGTGQAAVSCGGTAATSDVSFSVNYPPVVNYYATSCASLNIGNQNPSTITTAFNNALTGAGTADDFTFAVRDDSAGGAASAGSALGINFSLTADVNSNNGGYILSWTDPGPTNLPLIVDIGITLKAGQGTAAYILPDVLLTQSPNSGTGTFEIVLYPNKKGKTPGLSGLSILIGNPQTPPPPPPPPPPFNVPEPASMALLGMGLLGLGFAARRRRG